MKLLATRHDQLDFSTLDWAPNTRLVIPCRNFITIVVKRTLNKPKCYKVIFEVSISKLIYGCTLPTPPLLGALSSKSDEQCKTENCKNFERPLLNK